MSQDLHVPFDPNEGWNGFHAAHAVGGFALYPPAGGFFLNNYPPLSFYLVGALGLFTGDDIIAGRWIALAAFLFTALAIVGVARALGANSKAGLLGALFFVATLAFDTSYVGINDPQFLGHALGMAGLWVALAGPRTTTRMAGAGLLLSLAFFTKHNLVIQPIALFLWLLLVDRRAAARLAAAGTVCAGAGAAGFLALYDRSFWSQINSSRLFSWAASGNGLLGWLQVCGLPIAASLGILALHARHHAALFCLVYLIVSLAVGGYFEGGYGTMSNVLFDNLIALALCAAIGWQLLAQRGHKSWLAPAFAGCFVLVVAAMLGVRAANDDFYPRYWLDRQGKLVAETARTIERIRAQPGPVLCSDLSLCYWAGKSPEVDAWGFRQAMLTGRRDGRDLEAAIASGRYALIVGNDLDLWPEIIVTAVKRYYRLADTGVAGQVWLPR